MWSFNYSATFSPVEDVKDKISFKALLDSVIRCSLVYEEPETVKKLWSAPEENPLYTEILIGIQKCPIYFTSPSESNEDAQAYIWMDDTTIYLTFRGSSSMEDFLADAEVISKQLFEGKNR
jgi:hypothetical protein